MINFGSAGKNNGVVPCKWVYIHVVIFILVPNNYTIFSTSRLLFSRHGYGWSENKFDIENKWMKTHRQTSEGRKMKIKETVRAMRARNNPSVCKITKRKRLISVTNWIEDFLSIFQRRFQALLIQCIWFILTKKWQHKTVRV